MPSIIGGKFKRSKIEVPHKLVRPTSALKREAIFSILESYALQNSIDIYENKSIIDVYAGSGLIGLEAISRGMKKSYFIEDDEGVFEESGLADDEMSAGLIEELADAMEVPSPTSHADSPTP